MKVICSAFICMCDETLMGCCRYEMTRSFDDDDDDDVTVDAVDMDSDSSILLQSMMEELKRNDVMIMVMSR